MTHPLGGYDLVLPDRPSLDDLVAAVSDKTGTAIHVRRFPSLKGSKPNGIVIPMSKMFLVGHGPTGSELTQTVIVGHELGHVLLGHVSPPTIGVIGHALRCRPLAQEVLDSPDELDAERFSFCALRVLMPTRNFTGLERFLV